MDIYSFKSTLLKEGNRVYLRIPFNLWETCGQKGLIPVEVKIADISFECKLVPKGKGMYYIPVIKEIYNKIDFSEEIKVKFEVIKGLKRINSNSPYSKEKPIRKIDSINYIHQPLSGLCGQTSLAMLAGISVDEVIEIMKSKRGQGSISKVMETLDYFGFSYKKAVYTRGKRVKLPKCCIVNVRGQSKSRLMVYYHGRYYDPTYGVLEDYEYESIISYLEISCGG